MSNVESYPEFTPGCLEIHTNTWGAEKKFEKNPTVKRHVLEKKSSKSNFGIL